MGGGIYEETGRCDEDEKERGSLGMGCTGRQIHWTMGTVAITREGRDTLGDVTAPIAYFPTTRDDKKGRVKRANEMWLLLLLRDGVGQPR